MFGDGYRSGVILSDRTIRAEIEAGRIGIEPYDPAMIQPSSIDVRLDDRFLVFRSHTRPVIDVKQDLSDLTEMVRMEDDQPFILHPGEFVLGSTSERVRIPDDLVARIEGKSSLARLGLVIHSTAGFVDAGFEGHITLELSNVATLPITLRTPGTCETCHGNGAAPGSTPRTCPNCRGQGVVSSNQGSFSFTEPCRECQGVGTIVDEKCPECVGSGGVTKTRTINVRIPPGVAEGQRIRLSGRGEPGTRGGAAGDLFVLIRVRPDAVFGRSGDDLTLTVPVTFAEAALGADLRVPTLDAAVTLRVPPGTPSGRTLRVRGKGVARRDGKVGDLLVTIDVHVPAELSEAARQALSDYAAAAPPAPRERLDAIARERSSYER